MNLTYYCAIKAIFYKVIFSQKPCFEHLNVTNRYFIKTDIEEFFYDDDQNNFFIAKDREGHHLKVNSELSFQKSGRISQTLNCV